MGLFALEFKVWTRPGWAINVESMPVNNQEDAKKFALQVREKEKERWRGSLKIRIKLLDLTGSKPVVVEEYPIL